MKLHDTLIQSAETDMYPDVLTIKNRYVTSTVRVMLVLFAVWTSSAAWADDAGFLSIGPFEQGVYDGSAPFAVSDDCTQPGDDCNNNDRRIRTNDVAQYVWSVVAGGLSSSDAEIHSVIMEQTIVPGPGAEIAFLEIPAACIAPPAGNGGSTPESAITVHPDGSTSLLCNLGSLSNGEQKSFSVAVQPQTTSLNGATYSTQQSVYGLDATGNRVVSASEYVDDGVYTVSAAPAYDLIGDRVTINRGEVITADIGNGPEEGYIYQYTAHVAAASERGALGIEPLGETFSFTPGVFATHADGVTPYDLAYSVIECTANRFEWDGTVYGNTTNSSSAVLEAQSVVNSGSCEVSGNPTNGFTLTATGADTSGQRYPTETLDGTSLAAGPYFVAAYSLQIFVPFSEIDRADGTPGNNIGQLQLGACLSNFNPVSVTGVSNYFDAVEPGYNGAAMPSGNASNNCAGSTIAELTTNGEFSFRTLFAENDQGTLTQYLPLVSSFHAGDGVAEPEQAFGTMLFFRNNGGTPLSDFTACTVFDNSVQTITDRGSIGATPGSFAYEGDDSPAEFDSSQWNIQYGIAPITGDDPLDGNSDGIRDFNPVTGRYDGSWSRLQKLRCDSPTIDWHDDLASVDPASVNAVRYAPVNSATLLAAGQEIRLITPLSLRSDFFGGPYAGESIPSGTVAAAYGSFRSAEKNPDWHTNSYIPAPENLSADGDRVTIARAAIDVALTTLEPEAAAGVVSTVLAGNPVIWTASPVVRSTGFQDDVIDDLTLTLQLSAGSTYNANCTLTIPDGKAPDSIAAIDAGYTQLTWNLGNTAANATIEPVNVCVNTDPFLDAGTVVSASTTVTADNTVSSKKTSQAVSLGQAGALLTDILVGDALSSPNTDQTYTLRWTNFSTSASIDKPVMINVLPFNGDNAGLSPRTPASHFTGEIYLTGEPTVAFLNGSGPMGSEAPVGTFFYTADSAATVAHNPEANSSGWCTYTGSTFTNNASGVTCPSGWEDVTAIKFESAYDLETRGSTHDGMRIDYSLGTSGNSAGDTYTNVFAVDSSSLPAEQFLVSRRGSVSIVSFSISGTVFAAIDGDLDYDEGIDPIVPDGVTIELLNATSNALVSSATTSRGQYRFEALAPGEYIVSVPASVLDSAGDLPGWSAAADQGDSDEIIDINFGEPATVGIRTFPISLNAAPTEASRPDPIINLALTPNDADSDGISDIIEFGENAFIIDSIDSDNDGTADYIDTDSDGDSIPDSIEGSGDTDGDGIPDYVDTDSDADGIPDAAEGNTDTDGDGIPDYIDNNSNADLDGDRIPDSVEGTIDTDGDGIPDREDTDSDADGIPDSVEHNTDTDGDGTPNYIDTDSDADGIDDSIEGTDDINENGVPDYIDNQTDTDTDGDDIPDIFEGNEDTDGDGDSNSNDTDSDGDGIPDSIETVADAEGDGIPNYLDLDSDNDSIPDEIETAKDSDNDLVPDFIDLDSDNDSLTDIEESANTNRDEDSDGQLDNIIDANTDGIDDATQNEGQFIIDTDYDGVPDYVDLDSDNDGIPDVIETLGQELDKNRDGHLDVFIDENHDGRDDPTEISRLFVIDYDSDGIPNHLDLDSDGDTRSDVRESGGDDQNGDFIIDPMGDLDTDSVQDSVDADQSGGKDADADGIDDTADIDFIGDLDSDSDGIIDSSDPDANGDGYIDTSFHDPELGNPYPDFDSNGTPDFQQSLTGIITSGVGGEGIGCSIGNTSVTADRFDPALLLMLLTSALCLVRRRLNNQLMFTRH